MNKFRYVYVTLLALSALSTSAFAAPTIAGGQLVTSDDPIARTTVGLIGVYPPADGGTEPQYAICTASLIAKNLVVTAAHCVDGAQKAALVFGLTMDKTATILYGDKVAIHPNWDEKKTINDVAVLRFKGEIPASFEPIELAPTSTVMSKGDMTTLSGYGITDLKTGEGSGVLRKVKEPFYQKDAIQKGTLLFAHRKDTGICPGDSGGPALLKSGSKYMLLGVASYLLAPDEAPCGVAGAYTDLTNESIRDFVDYAKDALQQ